MKAVLEPWQREVERERRKDAWAVVAFWVGVLAVVGVSLAVLLGCATVAPRSVALQRDYPGSAIVRPVSADGRVGAPVANPWDDQARAYFDIVGWR